MRHLALTVLLLSSASPAPAQEIGPDEASVLPRLIDSLCIDIHDNIGCEALVLLASVDQPDAADLLILTDHRDGGAPLLVARNVVFNGAMWGMAPYVERRDGEGFFLHSEQTGVGRHPWTQTLTVVWREGRFVVSGYTFTSYDRIENDSYSCDINLRTGAYVSEVAIVDHETETEDVTREAGTGPVIDIALEDWARDWREPEVCHAAAQLYYSP